MQRGDLRPGHRRHDLPHAGRGDRARQQHALRPRRQRVERDHRPRARRRAQAAGRRGVGQRHQPVRRGGRLRRLSRIRLRPRRRAGRLLRISEAQGLGGPQAAQGGRAAAAADRTRWLRPAFARPHRQAVHRRQAGAARRQLFPRHRLARRQAGRRSRRGQPQGHPQRRRRRARRRGLVARHQRTTARRSSITSRRTCPRAPTSSPAASPR